MAVMKVCCGCMSTRSGTLAILLLYLLAYIGGIVFLGITIGNGDLEMWYKKYAVDEYMCQAKESIKDSWWCTAINDLQYGNLAFSQFNVRVSLLMLMRKPKSVRNPRKI